MSEPIRRGNLRMICLVCGQEIEGRVQLTEGRARPALTLREGRPAGTGYVHPGCGGERLVLDLTGKPDYSDYNEDDSYPAYAPGYDAVARGKGFDAAMRAEAAQIAARDAEKGQQR